MDQCESGKTDFPRKKQKHKAKKKKREQKPKINKKK
jgi:hypothetical protein